MTKEEYDNRFFELMDELVVVFSCGASERIGIIYLKYLNDIPIRFLERGVERIIRTRTLSKFPTVAEIRKLSWTDTEKIELERHSTKEDMVFNKKVEGELKK